MVKTRQTSEHSDGLAWPGMWRFGIALLKNRLRTLSDADWIVLGLVVWSVLLSLGLLYTFWTYFLVGL